MERIKKIYGRCSGSFFYALAMNGLLLFFYLHFFYPYYESNDDFSLKAIVSGLYGFYDHHMVYMNVLIGYLLKGLYSLSGGIAWYDYFHYFLIFLSLSVITDVLLKRERRSVLNAAAIFTAAYSLYVRPQYSKTASLLACAGILLLADGGKRKLPFRILSVFLLVTGCCFRDLQFFPCAFICFAVLLSDLIGIFKGRESEECRKAADLLKWGILSLVLIGAVTVFDRLSYRDELWSYYRDYNKARTELFDYGFPDYHDNIDVYEKLDIDEDTLYLYQETWNFDDPEKLGLENMKELIEVKKRNLSFSKFSGPALFTLKNFFTDTNTLVYTLLSFASLLLVILTGEKKQKISALFLSLFFFICIVLTSYLRPYVVLNRVNHGFLFCFLFSLLYLYGQISVKSKKVRIAELALMLCVPALLYFQMGNLRSWNEDSSLKQYEKNLAIAYEISADKEHVYLFDTIANVLPLKKIFTPLEKGLLENRLMLGGWGTNSSWNTEIKKKYGVENPFRDCIQNEKVILVSNQPDAIMDYIHKYYDANAIAVANKEVSSLNAYWILSEADER